MVKLDRFAGSSRSYFLINKILWMGVGTVQTLFEQQQKLETTILFFSLR